MSTKGNYEPEFKRINVKYYATYDRLDKVRNKLKDSPNNLYLNIKFAYIHGKLETLNTSVPFHTIKSSKDKIIKWVLIIMTVLCIISIYFGIQENNRKDHKIENRLKENGKTF